MSGDGDGHGLRALTLLLVLGSARCGVLIISPQFLEIPSLRLFDEKLYHSLKDSIDNGKIVSYLWELPTECGYFGHSRNTAYLPSVIYFPEDAIGEHRLIISSAIFVMQYYIQSSTRRA